MAQSYSKLDSTYHADCEKKEAKKPKPIPKINEKRKSELSGPVKKDFAGNRLYSIEELKKLQNDVVRTNRKNKPVKSNPDPEAKLWKQFSIYIRERDADRFGMCRCITSGKMIHWVNTDCGHGIGRQHRATKYHEQNNHAQGRKHNRFEEGRKDLYSKEVDRRYGAGTWEKLEILSRTTYKKLSSDEINVLTEHYRSEANRIKKEKGL